MAFRPEVSGRDEDGRRRDTYNIGCGVRRVAFREIGDKGDYRRARVQSARLDYNEHGLAEPRRRVVVWSARRPV